MEEFVVQCVGYMQNHEKNFTIGKEYTVKDGRITADNGYTYSKDPCMIKDSTPDSWWLSTWYQFEIVDKSPREVIIPSDLTITFTDIMGQ